MSNYEAMPEGMTDEQFQVFLKLILQILKDSESKEDAIEKLENIFEL